MSGSSKPIFQLMMNLEKNGVQTTMLSDHLSEATLNIHNILLNKYRVNLDIQRTNNLNKGLLKSREDVIHDIISWWSDCDLLISTDFLIPWLLSHNNIKLNTKIIFLGSNNMNFKFRYLIDSGFPALINLYKPSFFSKYIFRGFLLQNLLNRFDFILTTSNYVKSEMKILNLNVPIFSLPIGVDVKQYSPLNLSETSFLYFGWGSGIRGLQDVLKSFEVYSEEYDNSYLNVCLQGQHGPEESFYANMINKSRIKNKIHVHFFTENIESLIKSSTAVILPFRIPFGYSQPPLAVLESMSFGRVVISTNVGCIPEIISHKSDGFLINPNSPNEILDVLMSLDNSVVNNIGSKAHEKIHNFFSWEIVTPQYIRLFSEILEGFYD
ncbi:glycosyltransferase family 4 protein [Methanosarcina vacuolata]|uniref:glycosyltransferase family 4 protein n=1 Tax=Methanosarcina vacuolata TaxID=2215 RepID=UPI0012F6AB97|nr:glycosyltransferase [Methanosarcina vacuolata]